MGRIDAPMARTSDPFTSKLAAAQYTASGKLGKRQAQVLRLVVLYDGRTSGELSRYFYHKYSGSIKCAAETPHKRLPELERQGLVYKGEPRKCSDSGYMAAVWHPTAEGVERFWIQRLKYGIPTAKKET